MSPLLLLVALSPTTSAWNSKCYVDAEHRLCSAGYESVRHRWRSEHADWGPLDQPEHALLYRRALLLSGIPEAVDDAQSLPVATSGLFFDVVVEAADDRDPVRLFTSLDPLAEAPGSSTVRVTTASEMAQLPDHAYTLWDWARGNEHCPIDPTLHPQACHAFEGHMGGLNSSHFPPQSQHFYGWYHSLAVARALECAALDVELGAHADTHQDTLLACEKEAMLLEGIGQHYLQDAWSAGHMWERWGGPRVMDFHDMSYAAMIGAYAGTWHGAKAVLTDHDDPLCAPPPAGTQVVFDDPFSGTTLHAVGDVFMDTLLHDPQYEPQEQGLFACSVQGLREVYAATTKRHGPLEHASIPLDREDPMGPECFAQRVTNATLHLGAQLHLGRHPDQVSPAGRDYATLLASMIYAKAPDAVEPDVDEVLLFRHDAARNRMKLALYAGSFPDGTDIADGGLLPIVGTEQNSGHLVGVLGDLDRPPAPFLEPDLPWRLDGSDNARALALTFSDAHAADICRSTPVDRAASLALWAYASPALDEEESAARLALCTQLAGPFLALGWPDHRPDGDSALCEALGGDWLWTRHDDLAGLTRATAVRDWCTTEPSWLRDGSFEQDSGAWQTTNHAGPVSSVYGQGPAVGTSMLELRADPGGTGSYAIAAQFLAAVSDTSGGGLPAGDYVLRFQQRTITHEDNHWVDLATCEANLTPWFVARIDSSAGNTIVYDSDPTDWCATMQRLDGVHYAEPAWVAVEVPFTLPHAVPDAALTFQVGTTNPHRHIVLVDAVTLGRAE